MGLPANVTDEDAWKFVGKEENFHPSAPYETSSDDDDSASTASSTLKESATSLAIQPEQGIGKVDISDSTNTHIGTSVNAQDTHIGHRISASNVNIIMAGSDLPKWTDDVVKTINSKTVNGVNRNVPSMNPYPPGARKQKPLGFLRRRRKVLTIVLLMAAILVTAVTAVIVWWLVQDHKSSGPGTTSTTGPPIGTITTTTPTTTRTHHPITPGTITLPTSAPAPMGGIVSRSEWGGMEPPHRSARSGKFENILVDNLHGKVEENLSESMDYNFLIDDAGLAYEARGWYYSANSDKDTSLAYPADYSLQIALIGDNSNDTITDAQKARIQAFVSNSTFTDQHVVSNPTIRGQCAMNIASETGPDLKAMCYIMEIGGVINPCIHSKCSACTNGVVNCR
ncbi:Hypothetical protein NTJ_12272 [Nesidiocoris tenuis]|uniref:Uncharacterized protein n=1 Tax=Nesidiocoris tenuis TaxID=355587 RepID=A0ABN7B4X6_9HEMI|nr:Hypothetical protein NTJ_12272 [Nesidiocoris tenuis]